MDQDNNAAYYRARERIARALAEASNDPAIRRIHLDMANRYAEKVTDLADGSPRQIPLKQRV